MADFAACSTSLKLNSASVNFFEQKINYHLQMIDMPPDKLNKDLLFSNLILWLFF